MEDEVSAQQQEASERFNRAVALIHRRTALLDAILRLHSLPSQPDLAAAPTTANQSTDSVTAESPKTPFGTQQQQQQQGLRKDQALWMGTVVLSGQDVDRHFTSASSPIWSDDAIVVVNSASTNGVSAPPPRPVNDSWLRDHCTRWYRIGFGLAALLVSDAAMGVVDFCNSAHELLLESEHAASAGTLIWRAQCDRALRKERERRGVTNARLPTSVGYSFHTAPHLPYVPAYKRTVASACHTICVAYRRFMDPDLANDEQAFRRFLAFDSSIHSDFIQPIVTEVNNLASAKATLEMKAVANTLGGIVGGGGGSAMIESMSWSSPTPAAYVDPVAAPAAATLDD